MNIRIALLAALALGTALVLSTSPARAADAPAIAEDEHGHSLYEGNQAQMVAAITDSLRRDDKGNAALDPAQCAKKQTGCVSPNQLIVSLVNLHPELAQLGLKKDGETLAKLPAFYAGMHWHIIDEVFESAREVGGPGNWTIDYSGGYNRRTHPGEIVYYVTMNGKDIDIAFGDCWNTLLITRVTPVTVVVNPCVRLIPSSSGLPEGAKVFAMHIDVVGEREVHNMDKCSVPPPCPYNCDLRDAEQNLVDFERDKGVEISIEKRQFFLVENPQPNLELVFPSDLLNHFGVIICIDVLYRDKIYRSDNHHIYFKGAATTPGSEFPLKEFTFEKNPFPND